MNIAPIKLLIVSVVLFFSCRAMNYDSAVSFCQGVEEDKPVRSYCFHPSSGSILVGFADATVSLIDLQTGDRRGWTGEANLLSISIDGASVAGVSDDGAVSIRDLTTGNLQSFLGFDVYYNFMMRSSSVGGASESVVSLKCRPTALFWQNKNIVIGDASGSVLIWDSEAGVCLMSCGKKNGSSVDNLWQPFFLSGCFWGESGGSIYKFSMKDKMVGKMAVSGPFYVAKDSNYFVMVCEKETRLNCVETRFLLANASTHRVVGEYSIGNYKISSICLVGRFVVLGTIDGNVLVFDLSTEKILAVYYGVSKHPIRRLELSANGKNIAFFVKDKLTVLNFYELNKTNKWVLELNAKCETKQRLVLPSFFSWFKE